MDATDAGPPNIQRAQQHDDHRRNTCKVTIDGQITPKDNRTLLGMTKKQPQTWAALRAHEITWARPREWERQGQRRCPETNTRGHTDATRAREHQTKEQDCKATPSTNKPQPNAKQPNITQDLAAHTRENIHASHEANGNTSAAGTRQRDANAGYTHTDERTDAQQGEQQPDTNRSNVLVQQPDTDATHAARTHESDDVMMDEDTDGWTIVKTRRTQIHDERNTQKAADTKRPGQQRKTHDDITLRQAYEGDGAHSAGRHQTMTPATETQQQTKPPEDEQHSHRDQQTATTTTTAAPDIHADARATRQRTNDDTTTAMNDDEDGAAPALQLATPQRKRTREQELQGTTADNHPQTSRNNKCNHNNSTAADTKNKCITIIPPCSNITTPTTVRRQSPITRKPTINNKWTRNNLAKYRKAMEPHDWNYYYKID